MYMHVLCMYVWSMQVFSECIHMRGTLHLYKCMLLTTFDSLVFTYITCFSQCHLPPR